MRKLGKKLDQKKHTVQAFATNYGMTCSAICSMACLTSQQVGHYTIYIGAKG